RPSSILTSGVRRAGSSPLLQPISSSIGRNAELAERFGDSAAGPASERCRSAGRPPPPTSTPDGGFRHDRLETSAPRTPSTTVATVLKRSGPRDPVDHEALGHLASRLVRRRSRPS